MQLIPKWPTLPDQHVNQDIVRKFVFAAFVLLIILHLLSSFAGFYNDDDINYARAAAKIAHEGINYFPATDHFDLRWSTIYITASFYWLFGINTFSSSLCAVISFILCGYLLYRICKKQHVVVYILVMVMLLFSHSVVFYIHRLLPDTLMCFLILWMYYCYWSVRSSAKSNISYGVQFAIAAMLAVITKESIIIVLPWVVFLFFYDLCHRKIKFWLYATAAFCLLLILYGSYFYITTGDVLYRYHILLSKSYFNECSYNQLPVAYTLQRVGYHLMHAFLLNGDMIVFIPAICGIFYRKKLEGHLSAQLHLTSFVVLLCAANFMSISFTSYVPLCPAPRHFLFLLPFAALAGAPMIYSYFNKPRQFNILPLLFIVSAMAMFLFDGGQLKYLYAAIAVLVTGSWIISFFKQSKAIAWCSIVLYMAVNSINYFIPVFKAPFPYFYDHKEIIEHEFSAAQKPATIFVADGMSAELSEYFMQFKTGHTRFVTTGYTGAVQDTNTYYLVNAILQPAAKKRVDSLMRLPQNPGIRLVRQKHDVYLYKITDPAVLRDREDLPGLQNKKNPL